MNEQTRYRITGSLFVAALAIIFLPMLFDGAGVNELHLSAIEPLSTSRAGAIPRQYTSEPSSNSSSIMDSSVLERSKVLDRKITQMQKKARLGETAFVQASEAQISNKLVWGVQLGSFNSEENAQTLQKKLEKDGYHAVLSRAKKNGATITRVAVGPMIREADAHSLRDKLSSSYKVEALVVNFEY
ncbi:MAG: SPOR domain-containing protein [Pseudomonadales bacterium]|nr:SPOR domain-containing protein [Pseudomonadales bacterium]